ncbi:MAG: hypothetical protein KF696_04290 [Planctomycetes bacterium]|nr:hypothetical protein [Planctomycetota bacterium]MCW8134192.1 hypothetical protein [Planctomycetota bacterium]
MHVITKVLIIVNLVLCLILSQYVWVALAGNVQWREKYEFEVNARHQDKAALEDAYARLLAQRATNAERTSQNSAEVAALNATKQALEAWKLEANLAAADAQRAADDLLAATQPFTPISRGYDQDVVQKLQGTVEQLSDRKSALFRQRGEALWSVAQAQNVYAEKNEQFRRVEYHHFLLQEEHERRMDTQARYRWLRPDIQKDLGDNGPVIFANVNWAVGNSLQLNKGKRDGVELYQKYTIMRNGSTIAVVNVVEVQNETCECLIEDLVSNSVRPQKGDEAVTRLFMARLTRR